MAPFAERCGEHSDAREAAVQSVLQRLRRENIDLVRVVWCDLHGMLRGKALTPTAVEAALREGIGMVSTVMLKDSSDRTAFKVFDRDGTAGLPGFGQANNLVLLPDPNSFTPLPWAPGSAWLRAQAWFDDATPVPMDSRRVLQHALAALASRGLAMQCGLELEFHIYRIRDATRSLDPQQADWPGPVPQVDLIHPGYQLLGDACFDLAEAPLRIVQHTAQGLGLPLSSLEIELGPSQVEAVFAPCDALLAADRMVMFRNGVKMALQRAGYHATFMCRPPFPNIMSSGWHVHQSLVDQSLPRNAFMRTEAAHDSSLADAANILSPMGENYLAGLLAHASATTAIATPTVNGFGRFRPNTMAPHAVLWGRDNRGAMLRVLGGVGHVGTRIENRIGEPAANPYLTLASQLWAGLDGFDRKLRAPPATDDPYGAGAERLPNNLGDALDALGADTTLVQALGADVVALFTRVKRQEIARHAQAEDPAEFERREYFGRT